MKCESCHREQHVQGQAAEPAARCHKKDDERAKHRGRYGDRCQTCHTETAWKPATFDHARDTRYALRGKHAKVMCDNCHRGDLYRDKLQTACISCHEKDDKHKGQLGRQCESCHGEQDWKKTTFDHNRSKFPLVGRHVPPNARAAIPDSCIATRRPTASPVTTRTTSTSIGSVRGARPAITPATGRSGISIMRAPNTGLKARTSRVDCLACHREPVTDKITSPPHASVATARRCACRPIRQSCEHCHVSDAWYAIDPRSASAASYVRPQLRERVEISDIAVYLLPALAVRPVPASPAAHRVGSQGDAFRNDRVRSHGTRDAAPCRGSSALHRIGLLRQGLPGPGDRRHRRQGAAGRPGRMHRSRRLRRALSVRCDPPRVRH